MTTRSIGVLDTADPINSTAPTGGVKSPIPQFRITIIPNWIGSIPIDVAIGRRIGVAIRMIGAISIIHPSTRRIKFNSSASRIGLSVRPMIAPAARTGTWRRVRQLPKMLEVAIRIRTMDSVSTQSPRTLQTPFQSSPL